MLLSLVYVAAGNMFVSKTHARDAMRRTPFLGEYLVKNGTGLWCTYLLASFRAPSHVDYRLGWHEPRDPDHLPEMRSTSSPSARPSARGDGAVERFGGFVD